VAALNAVNMALLTDGSHNISYDSVLEVMIRTGKDMNSKYKETSQAGLATAFVSCPNIPLSRIRQHAAE
jgi:L-serine dehydratase